MATFKRQQGIVPNSLQTGEKDRTKSPDELKPVGTPQKLSFPQIDLLLDSVEGREKSKRVPASSGNQPGIGANLRLDEIQLGLVCEISAGEYGLYKDLSSVELVNDETGDKVNLLNAVNSNIMEYVGFSRSQFNLKYLEGKETWSWIKSPLLETGSPRLRKTLVR